MPTYAKIRTDGVILNPVAAAGLPNNSLFVDVADSNKFKNKNDAGTSLPVESSLSLYSKTMQSGLVGVIPINTPVSKRADGKIVPADSDEADGQQPVGITMVAFPNVDALGAIHLFAPNVGGVIASMGFVPGEEIFLGETGGYTNNPNSFTGDNDSIIRIGLADCPAGIASPVATDLIISTQVILRP